MVRFPQVGQDTRALKVLHIDTGRKMRGGQWQALMLMRALARRGHLQRLLGRAGSPLLDRAQRDGVATTPLRPGLRLPAADIIHAHDAGAHTAAVSRARSAPLVVARRVAFPVRRGWLSRQKYGRADHYIAVSRYVARELQHAGIAEDRISVIHDGVSLPDRARAAELRAQYRAGNGIPADAFVAGALATPGEKPLAPLLEAAATRPRLHVVVASNTGDDVAPFFFALDVFVHLSESEGLGSAALLAMAHSLPVIASDVGGLPEIVRPGETGLLVRNVAAEVGAALEQLYRDRAASAAMGARGRRFVEQNATDDIMAAKTEQVYLQVIARK